LVSRRPLGIRPDQIRNPPCFDFTGEQKRVGDPEPIVEPARIRSAEVADAEDQSHSEERRLNECGDEKIPYRNFAANRGDVIESGQWHPVVQRQGTAHEKPAVQLRSVRARRIRIFTTKDTKVAEKSHC